MKKLFIFYIFIFFNTFVFSQNQPRELYFSVEDTYIYPILMNSGSEVLYENGGVFIDTIILLEKKLGIKLKIIRYPLNRALVMLKEGKVDAYLTLSYKPEREEYCVYPKKDNQLDLSLKFEDSSYFFYCRSAADIIWDSNNKKIINLKTPIGAQSGYSVNKILENLGYKLELVEEVKENFLKLQHNRLDIIIAHENTGDAYVFNANKLFKKIEPPVSTNAYFIVLSHQFFEKYPELALKIWQTGRDIATSAEYQTLKAKYYALF